MSPWEQYTDEQRRESCQAEQQVTEIVLRAQLLDVFLQRCNSLVQVHTLSPHSVKGCTLKRRPILWIVKTCGGEGRMECNGYSGRRGEIASIFWQTVVLGAPVAAAWLPGRLGLLFRSAVRTD